MILDLEDLLDTPAGLEELSHLVVEHVSYYEAIMRIVVNLLELLAHVIHGPRVCVLYFNIQLAVEVQWRHVVRHKVSSDRLHVLFGLHVSIQLLLTCFLFVVLVGQIVDL